MEDGPGRVGEPALGAAVGYFLEVACYTREGPAGAGCACEPVETPREL